MNERAQAAGRIVAAREGAGLSTAAAARAAGLTVSCYYDLEAYDDEVFTSISLGQLCRLATALGTRAEKLIGSTEHAVPSAIPPEALVALLQTRILGLNEDTHAFGERVGWDIEGLLSSPERLWEHYTVDSLQDICRELGLDWANVLASWQPAAGPSVARVAEQGIAPDNSARRR